MVKMMLVVNMRGMVDKGMWGCLNLLGCDKVLMWMRGIGVIDDSVEEVMSILWVC